MKLNGIACFMVFAIGTGLSVLAHASPALSAPTEIWEGSGALFDAKGNSLGDYQLKVENTDSAGQTQSSVTVTHSDGSVQTEQCLITAKSKDGWKSTCGFGQGGGRCFGEGICTSYEVASSGNAFATTIISDGPKDLRMLRTELQNGQATRFFREKLHKR